MDDALAEVGRRAVATQHVDRQLAARGLGYRRAPADHEGVEVRAVRDVMAGAPSSAWIMIRNRQVREPYRHRAAIN